MENHRSSENNKNEGSSTTDPHDSSKKQSHHLSSNQLKIYNIMYNNFSYEHDVLCQRNLRDFDMDKSTPSILSEQSMAATNNFLNSVPVFKEIILYGDGNLSSNYLTQSEFFKILKKLRITNNLEIALNLLEKFDIDKDNQISFKEFILFFCKDIRTLDFEEALTPEIVFRLGIEIFRVISKERTYLELRDLMHFLKENESLDIDFIQLLEMFDFYDDIYSGTLKRKVNILSFFQNTGLKIAKAIDRSFLQYLKNLFKDLRAGNEPLRKVFKVYEKPVGPEESIKKTNAMEQSLKKAELKKIFERNFNQMQNINEIIIEDVGTENNLQREIEEFFKENQPKNKGWLFRKSQENGTNWQNLFFCLINNNTKLISLNPKNLKKALNIANIQIHKCNFLECLPHEQILYKNNKKIVKKTSESEENSKKTFFIVDLVNMKTYLIRSDESMAILSVINFYISKNKTSTKQNVNSLIQIIETVEPYYSGIIEIACCKKHDLGTFHSDLKNYSFKSQFLEIKSNKLLIYKYALKDTLNILEYDLKVQDSVENKGQGFMFSLEKKTTPISPPDFENDNNMKSMKESFVVFNTLCTHENGASNAKIEASKNLNNNKNDNKNDKILKNFDTAPNDKTNKKNNNILNKNSEVSPHNNIKAPSKNDKSSFHNFDPHFNELEVIYEKDEGNNEKRRKGGGTTGNSFKEFFLKLTGKKNEKVFLTADTEFKRKEWVFSLNYYKTLILKDLIRKKNEAHGIRPSGHESMNGKVTKNMNNFFKSSLIEKNTHNPDFYDVFSPNDNDDSNKRNAGQNNGPHIKNPEVVNTHMNFKPPKSYRNPPAFYTDPDGARNLESEDLLFTFTNLNADSILILNNQKSMANKANVIGQKYFLSQNNENSANWLNVPNKEIKTFKEEELWQKFLKYFLKTNHPCTEMEMADGGGNQSKGMCNESTSMLECENESEDMPRARPIFQCHYNLHK